MTQHTTGTSPLVHARIAGLLALTTLATGSFAGSVTASLVVPGDAAATVANIAESEPLFRLGTVSILAMYVVFVPYVLVLYRLLEPVGKGIARLMVAFALLGVPVAMLNQVHQAEVLLLATGADYLETWPADRLHAQVMLSLDLLRHGALIGALFWGLWLFPLGLLVFRSRCFPRVLGVLLMVGCTGWLILFLQRFLLPEHEGLGNARFAAHAAELAWMGWLLLRGVHVERWQRRAWRSA